MLFGHYERIVLHPVDGGNCYFWQILCNRMAFSVLPGFFASQSVSGGLLYLLLANKVGRVIQQSFFRYHVAACSLDECLQFTKGLASNV
jgi:hypothetical protein